MTDPEALPALPHRDWVAVHAHARHQRARLMRIVLRRAWRHLRRSLRRAVPAAAARPAYEYWT